VGIALFLTILPATLLMPLGGCQLFNEQLTAAPGPVYPENAQMIEVLDVQVFRDVTVLRFTNSTTNDFAPGETVELDLRQFVDEYGDTYKAGGFFAQRDPAPVVLAQLEANSPEGEPVLYGLVVVQNKYD
jgi:hypothetical protein